jgi:hypothetical protein
MMAWLTLAVAWLVGGLYMVSKSRSRGFAADALFVFTWPYHVAAHLLGRE